MSKKIPPKNRSPYGWWIACFIERFEYYDEDTNNPNRKCCAWENTILIKARERNEAYRKAMKCGGLSEGIEAWDSDTGRKGAWRFEGLTMLLPVFQELEDGAEVLWVEHLGRTVRKIKSFVKKKHELEAFNDNVERD